MRKAKSVGDAKIDRPRRAVITRKEALKRMKDSPNERRDSLPLLERARVEAYVPDLPSEAYRTLLEALDREFTYAFGGCTISRALVAARRPRNVLVYDDFPWFGTRCVSSSKCFSYHQPYIWYWPDLDIDLAVESIEHPEGFP